MVIECVPVRKAAAEGRCVGDRHIPTPREHSPKKKKNGSLKENLGVPRRFGGKGHVLAYGHGCGKGEGFYKVRHEGQ